GIYRRTFGVWSSLNTGLRNTEFWSVAYDPLNDDIIGGSQDVAVSQQTPGSAGTFEWQTPFLGNLNAPGKPSDGEPQFAAGDGGVVAVDASDPAQSIRYFMGNNFSAFYRTAFDNTDTQVNIGNTSGITDPRNPLFSRKNFQAATVLLASPNNPNGWLSG